MTQNEITDIFKKCGVLKEGHFLLTSGRHSAKYMQCAQLFTHAEHSEQLCAALADKLASIKIDAVVSPAVGGIIMGYEMSRHLFCTNIFAEREDGKMTLRRGFTLSEGQNVLICEDVVTTGGSVKEVIELVRQAGANPVAVAAIVDRSNGKVDFGIPLKTLLSIEIASYEAAECPMCAQGLPINKPGSRKL